MKADISAAVASTGNAGLLEPVQIGESTHSPGAGASFWHGRHFIWKQPGSWIPHLTAWLTPHFRADGRWRLKPGYPRDLCCDDPEWSRLLGRCLVADLDDHLEVFAGVLEHAVLRTYHGCRTEDAGSYFRSGLRVHDPTAMMAQLRSIVEKTNDLAFMKNSVDEVSHGDRPRRQCSGRVYVFADDTVLLEEATHFLIYGSEWAVVQLGPAGRQALLCEGTPTLLEIDLPLGITDSAARKELASSMFSEWTRFACNRPNWSAPIDFSFCLRSDIPAACIVGHSHPAELRDHLDNGRIHRAHDPTCAHCRRS